MDCDAEPYIIVVGSEKGGTGKSTTAMHLAVALMAQGFRVGTLDLDARQGSLSRYVENRRFYAGETGTALDLPRHCSVAASEAPERRRSNAEDQAALDAALAELAGCDFAVLDTPGSDSHLSRLGHAKADTLVTPLNDSLVDIAVLAQIDRQKREVQAPSVYSRMVWEQNNRRVGEGRHPIDWIVMRNRLTHIEARNKRDIANLLGLLAQRIGFRLAPGFGERVIYRELFLNGLTVLDLPESAAGKPAVASHRAARDEVVRLLEVIGIFEEAETREAV